MLAPWIAFMIVGIFSFVMRLFVPNCDGIISFALIASEFLVMVLNISKQRIGKQAKCLFMFGILLRIFMLWWDLNCRSIYALPNSGQDSEMYYYGAVNGYQYGEYSRSGNYGIFLSLWMRLFGVQRDCIQFTNTLLAFSTIIVVIGILEELDINSQTMDRIVILISLLPNTMIINSILLRETLIAFLITVSLYFFVKWLGQASVIYLILSFILSFAATAVHSGAIAIALGEAIILILYNRESNLLRISWKSIVTSILVVLVFAIVYTQFDAVFFGKFGRLNSIESITDTANLYNHGGSSYNVGFKIDNDYLDLLVNTPIRMIYFIASPMPWDWRGISDVLAFVFSSLVFVYALYCAIREIRTCDAAKTKTKIWFLFLLCLCSAAVFAWGVSNAGTALRHREKFTAVFIVLIAVCSDAKRCRLLENANEEY